MGEKLLMKGNEVIAEAALRAGCRHYFGYPITPQTEVAHYMAKKMEELRRRFRAGGERGRGDQYGIRRGERPESVS